MAMQWSNQFPPATCQAGCKVERCALRGRYLQGFRVTEMLRKNIASISSVKYVYFSIRACHANIDALLCAFWYVLCCLLGLHCHSHGFLFVAAICGLTSLVQIAFCNMMHDKLCDCLLDQWCSFFIMRPLCSYCKVAKAQCNATEDGGPSSHNFVLPPCATTISVHGIPHAVSSAIWFG